MALRLRIRLPTAPPDVEARAVDVEDGVAEIRLGRRAGLEIELPFATVSALHARLFREDASWVIEDLRSTNGTCVEGERLPAGGRRVVRPGHRLRLADVDVLFEGLVPTAGAGRAESTGTIARRLVSDLFHVMNGMEVARLLVEDGPGAGRVLRLAQADRPYKIGRGDSCDLVLPDEDASREHAEVRRRWEGVHVSDLGSKNGVFLDSFVGGSEGGERITAERRLRDGDLLQIGGTRLRLDDPEDRYLRDMEARPEAMMEAPTVPVTDDGAGAAVEIEAAASAVVEQARAALQGAAPGPLGVTPPPTWLRAVAGIAVLVMTAIVVLVIWLAVGG